MNMYNNQNPQPNYGYGYNLHAYQRPMAQPIQDMSAQMAIPMAPQVNYIKGRPVVSIDEARASQIDLDGSLYVFPDLGNKRIYTKQINMDGTASFNVFELCAPKESATPIYVTKDELDAILLAFKESLIQHSAPEPAVVQPKTQINKNFNL